MTTMLKDISLIEVELMNYCNRSCPWCVLNYYKPKTYEELDLDKFRQVLIELNSFERGDKEFVISFTGFYEPMANMALLEKGLNIVRECMPDAYIKVITNGDFVDETNLDKLGAINKLNMMDYDSKYLKDDYFGHLGFIPVLKRHRERLYVGDKNVAMIQYRPNTIYTMEMEDRGGTLPEKVRVDDFELRWYKNREIRNEPCFELLSSLYIGSNGAVYPCSHVRDFVPQHAEYVIGNIYDQSVEEVLRSKAYRVLSERLVSGLNDLLPHGCQRCNKRCQRKMK